MIRERGRQPGKVDGQARQDAAMALAIEALGYLAGDPEHLERFLALTGIAPADIRTAARAPDFLAGVLDYIAGDEALLRAVAAHAGVAPEEFDKARQALSGGDWQRDVP
jgi:Protein of unknown function (DUF3572)